MRKSGVSDVLQRCYEDVTRKLQTCGRSAVYLQRAKT